MNYPIIKITTNGSPSPKNWNIFLDDLNISRYVRYLEVKASPTEDAEVKVTLYGDLELPDGIPVTRIEVIEDVT